MHPERATIFPTDLPAKEWLQFQAQGFSEPVCGVIHTLQRPATCGIPDWESKVNAAYRAGACWKAQS